MGSDPAFDFDGAIYAQGARDGAAAERERLRHALLSCRDCGKIHERRPLPDAPGKEPGYTYAHPDDGHPLALTLCREVVEDVLAAAAMDTR